MIMAQTKKQRSINDKVDRNRVYPIEEAFALVKDCATARFAEAVDVSINLGIDPRKSDQVVRGASVLPNGTGRTVRVAVFAQGEQADKAKAAGADSVGMDDLADAMKKGDLDYGVVIATPDAMRIVGQLGRVLGPRGLMPNPKVGTVTADVETAVKNSKGGQVRYRADKGGVLHSTIGKSDFEVKDLCENLGTLIQDINKLKPSSSKGTYIRKVTVSSTMGPGVLVDHSSLD